MSRFVWLLLLCFPEVVVAAPRSARAAHSGAVLFELTDSSGFRFIISLTEPETIRHARSLLGGTDRSRPHISGLIVKARAAYNPRWSYHLDPRSIRFFDKSIEVCDATMQYVEEHLGEVGDAFLPQSRWCPWSSMLTAELAAGASVQVR